MAVKGQQMVMPAHATTSVSFVAEKGSGQRANRDDGVDVENDSEEEVDIVGSGDDEYSDASDDEELSQRVPRNSRWA